VWWYIPVIPASQEVEVGESWSEAEPSKNMRPYLKNKLKAKMSGVLAQGPLPNFNPKFCQKINK
jgi:hypothetical protein